MRILHLASFVGNIGDIANHEGLYTQLRKLLNTDLEIEKLEMRLFYLNSKERKFDEKFAEMVNSYDLLIIGGGNFFELCWDYSSTGTTFDISNDILKMIDIPIFINGIGIDIDKGYNSDNIIKFKAFLDTLFTSNKIFFTIRNDGSKKVVDNFFKEYSNRIHEIPDHGYFVGEVSNIKDYHPNNSRVSIGINIALDMMEIRYKKISFNDFIKDLANVINIILEKYDIDIFLIPHIQSDYLAIVKLMENIKDYFVRSRISIAPLLVGKELETFKYYKDCKIVLGMRKHSTICSIGMEIPSFGMTTYPKTEHVYKELDLRERYLNIGDKEFFLKLKKEIELNLEDNDYNNEITLKNRVTLKKMFEQKENAYYLLNKWLIKNNLK